jgi:hypothetical protein
MKKKLYKGIEIPRRNFLRDKAVALFEVMENNAKEALVTEKDAKAIKKQIKEIAKEILGDRISAKEFTGIISKILLLNKRLLEAKNANT